MGLCVSSCTLKKLKRRGSEDYLGALCYFLSRREAAVLKKKVSKKEAGTHT